MTSDTEQDGRSRSPSADESESGSEAGEAGEDYDMEGKNGNGAEGGAAKKASDKDPSRPRRKKARRACYACQRAHLTCGDERPCQRCVKRGLQDSCQDGVRKKAKYLHDAPAEALLPGANRFPYMNNLQRANPPQQSPTNYPVTGSETFIRQPQSTYSGYGPSPPTSNITMNESLMSSDFNGPQSPLATQMPNSAGLPSATMQGLATTMPPQDVADGSNGMAGTTGFSSNFFDAGELAQYDFDPSSFKFGNVYGAIEFGMLGHLSSGAIAGSPPAEVANPMGQNLNAFATPDTIAMNTYGESPVEGNRPFIFNQDAALSDWRTTQPSQTQSNVRGGVGGTGIVGARRENGFFEQDPRAFSVGVNSAVQSPTSGRSPEQYSSRRQAPSPGRRRSSGHQDKSASISRPQNSQAVFNVATARAFAPKRKRGDPSAIYTMVTQPYSYITGFHNLIMLLQKRFPPHKVTRIAKALASIRPSFMSCTRQLGRDDLIFMEKCFQRTLWEYEDFINACGTPTVVCRRTGEIAAAGKEFSILTKWRRDILLGREPNLNINTGASDSFGVSANSSAARGGANTPRIPEHMIDNSRPHPVSLAELLDEDSVVAFYEDFARLAFGDSKGVVTTRYKLLKYRTKDDEVRVKSEADGEGRPLKRKRGAEVKPGAISGEAGIDDLGEDGKVECSCCWTVKRDIFDLPMMIVMNFLPCI